MKRYDRYCDNVKSGKITTCLYIKQAVDRFLNFRYNRKDIYFDEEATDACIQFISCIKHFKGDAARKNFILEDWQCFLVANVVGLKWKKDGTRVCREIYLQMARKQGKTALIAALALYFLIADGEASPEVACLATSREQAGVMFEYIQEFGKSLDPNGTDIKNYRNYIKFPSNKGICKVYSSDSGKLDGLNVSFGIIDEAAALPNNKLYSVIKSSMGMRTQPLLVQITTPQFNLDSPAYQTYQQSIELLAGVKENDTFFPFLYTLDLDDDWKDPNVWEKSNPNWGITVKKDFLINEVQNAINDSSQEVPVKIKNIGIWCSSNMSWIPQEKIANNMEKVDLHQFEGETAYLGVDLGSVSDFTSLTVLIVHRDDEGNEKYYFKTRTYLPEETLETHPQSEKYKGFVREGSMIITPGNVADYSYILRDILEINSFLNIEGIYYDSWNATQFAIMATDEGLNMQPYSQAIGNFNAPTKEFERLLLNGDCVLDKSSNILWQFGNVTMKIDLNGNTKPDKGKYNSKIDSVISIITSLGGYLKNPISNDLDIFIL